MALTQTSENFSRSAPLEASTVTRVAAAAAALQSHLAVKKHPVLNMAEYEWAEVERPLVAHNQFEGAQRIPVIDMSAWRGGTAAAAEMAAAARDWGFFQVVNHGVCEELLKKMQKQARVFFELDLEQKKRVLRNGECLKPMGYACGGYGTNLKADLPWMESLQLPSLSSDMEPFAKRIWGDGAACAEFRNVAKEFSAAMKGVAMRVVEALVEDYSQKDDNNDNDSIINHKHHNAIKTDKNDMKKNTINDGIATTLEEDMDKENYDKCSKKKKKRDKMKGMVEEGQNSTIRFNYYPPCEQPMRTLGLGAHSDPHVLTVLHQDLVGGLQIRDGDGRWITVQPSSNSLVINIGDALQVWSNDTYKSVEHRAVCNRLNSRMSMAFFLNPVDKATITPATTGHPLYRPFTWEEYRKCMYTHRPRGKSNLLRFRAR